MGQCERRAAGKVDSPPGDLEQPAAGDLTSHDLDFDQGRSSARPSNTPSASQPSSMASTLKAPTSVVRMGRKALLAST